MIKLITIIGHGTNLLTHFINHYKNQVDEINIDEAKLKKIGNEISAEADRALKKGKGFVDSLTSFFGKI